MAVTNTNKAILQIARGLAIISVICAHVNTVSSQNTFTIAASTFLSSIGVVGVVVFFIISGILYQGTEKSFGVFWGKKIKSIILPWFFCGTLDFLYTALRKAGISLYEYFDFIFIHSHYYFLTVLLVLYLVFWRIRRNNFLQILICVVSVFSIVATGTGHIQWIYPYINPFNWAFYFAIGVLISNNNAIYKMIRISKRALWISIAVLVILLIRAIYIMQPISYWSSGAIIFELAAGLFVFGLSSHLINMSVGKQLMELGDASFVIYLVHMPFAGFLTWLSNRIDGGSLVLFRPIITLSVVMMAIQSIILISDKLLIKKYIEAALGIRL